MWRRWRQAWEEQYQTYLRIAIILIRIGLRTGCRRSDGAARDRTVAAVIEPVQAVTEATDSPLQVAVENGKQGIGVAIRPDRLAEQRVTGCQVERWIETAQFSQRPHKNIGSVAPHHPRRDTADSRKRAEQCVGLLADESFERVGRCFAAIRRKAKTSWPMLSIEKDAGVRIVKSRRLAQHQRSCDQRRPRRRHMPLRPQRCKRALILLRVMLRERVQATAQRVRIGKLREGKKSSGIGLKADTLAEEWPARSQKGVESRRNRCVRLRHRWNSGTRRWGRQQKSQRNRDRHQQREPGQPVAETVAEQCRQQADDADHADEYGVAPYLPSTARAHGRLRIATAGRAFVTPASSVARFVSFSRPRLPRFSHRYSPLPSTTMARISSNAQRILSGMPP